MKYISRHEIKPLLKTLNTVLIGVQKANQNEDYVYIWLLYDVSDGISLNFVENARVFPRNSYVKVYITKEDAWELLSNHLEKVGYSWEKFEDFETDTYWIDAKGRFKEFIRIMEIHPKLNSGEDLHVQITNTTKLPKFIKDKIQANNFKSEEEKRDYIYEQIKSHLVSLVNSKEEEIDLILMPMADSNDNILFDEYEIINKEPKHKLIESVPISYDKILEQLNKY